jgi:hypothetical protein
MTPTLWERFREALGLPGKTRVTEIPSEDLAKFFFSTKNEKAGDCAPGQGQKEVRVNA